MNKLETYYRWSEIFIGRKVGGLEITDIKVIGPPSFVYGEIQLIFKDNSSMFALKTNIDAFRPSIKKTKEILDLEERVKE